MGFRCALRDWTEGVHRSIIVTETSLQIQLILIHTKTKTKMQRLKHRSHLPIPQNSQTLRLALLSMSKDLQRNSKGEQHFLRRL